MQSVLKHLRLLPQVMLLLFCRKLLGYSLGREVQLSDQPLLDRMLENLEKDDYRVHSAIRTILGSQPFLNVRDQDYVRPK